MGGYGDRESHHPKRAGGVGHAGRDTRAPGLPTAILRARRRGSKGVAAITMAFLAAGCALASGTPGDSGQPSPTEVPATASSSGSPTVASADPSPSDALGPRLGAELDALVAQVPGWAITDQSDRISACGDIGSTGYGPCYDYALTGPCSQYWRSLGYSPGGDGGVGSFGDGGASFGLEAQAVDATDAFVESLDSCSATAWRTEPIAQTGAVLAVSPNGVAWILQKGTQLRVIQVPTTDGSRPVDVQVKVAEWLTRYLMILERSRSAAP